MGSQKPFLGIAVLVAVAIIAAWAGYKAYSSRQSQQETATSHWDRPREVPGVMPAPTPETVIEPEARAEIAVTEPVQYFPPPTKDLTGGQLGNQVVPGVDEIGDVFKIYFHQPTQALFMAVVERDGTRSIWRLDQKGVLGRMFSVNDLPGEIQIDGDSKGVMYVQHDNPSRMYRTDNAFVSWRTVLENVDGMFWNIVDDGKGNVYGSMHAFNTAILYRSPDDGFSWEKWVDFQKVFPDDAVRYNPDDERFRLRHLHSVVYSEKSDAILVGTGDVARYALRSDDGGKTWKKFWDEGFTAATPVGGGNRYLLAPDQLHGHGLALYDAWKGTIKEVWNPIPYGWAGYSYSLLNAEGIYYAAFHTEANEAAEIVPKFGIIVSPDAEHWYPFLEWGPLGQHARTNIWLENAPGRVYASVNGRLYAFKPLDKDWFADKTPFGK